MLLWKGVILSALPTPALPVQATLWRREHRLHAVHTVTLVRLENGPPTPNLPPGVR